MVTVNRKRNLRNDPCSAIPDLFFKINQINYDSRNRVTSIRYIAASGFNILGTATGTVQIERIQGIGGSEVSNGIINCTAFFSGNQVFVNFPWALRNYRTAFTNNSNTDTAFYRLIAQDFNIQHSGINCVKTCNIVNYEIWQLYYAKNLLIEGNFRIRTIEYNAGFLTASRFYRDGTLIASSTGPLPDFNSTSGLHEYKYENDYQHGLITENTYLYNRNNDRKIRTRIWHGWTHLQPTQIRIYLQCLNRTNWNRWGLEAFISSGFRLFDNFGALVDSRNTTVNHASTTGLWHTPSVSLVKYQKYRAFLFHNTVSRPSEELYHLTEFICY